ncbi:MAG: hypothetical protein AB7E24_01100 [Novosphingobium sp.]
MSSFFEARVLVKAEELRGPRIYSTDLLPSHFDATDPDGSVRVAARALKVKLLTKGRVTLNSAYLLSPMAVLLLDRHADLFNGPAILPAFREDKAALADLVTSNEDMASHGIDAQRLNDHIARLEGLVTHVLPWSLGNVGELFRTLLVSGLANQTSLVVRTLNAAGFAEDDVAKLIADLQGLPLSESISLRTYIAGMPTAVREPLHRYAAACYHMVGTGVVRCEAGTDLSPLSAFKAADIFLAARDSRPELLSEEALFFEAFMGFALDTIQSTALPTQILDSLDFTTVHALSETLRAQGFQDKYDGIVKQYRTGAALPKDEGALASLEPEVIAQVAADLAREFRKSVVAELPHYTTQAQNDAREDVLQTRGDIAKDFVAAIPGVGNVISVADVLSHGAKALTAWKESRTLRDVEAALAEAHKARADKIAAAIAALKIDGKQQARFLDAVALLTDVHGIAIKRA